MGKFKFFAKNDCLTEYEWAFDSDFLQNLFQDNYKHKYSLSGNGIYNLVFMDNKIYDVELKKATSLLADDGKKAFRDTTKDVIVEMIVNKLKENNAVHHKGAYKAAVFLVQKLVNLHISCILIILIYVWKFKAAENPRSFRKIKIFKIRAKVNRFFVIKNTGVNKIVFNHRRNKIKFFVKL